MSLSELFKSVPLNSFRPKTKELIKSTQFLLLCNFKNDEMPPELFHLIAECLFYLCERELDVVFWSANNPTYTTFCGWVGEYTIGKIDMLGTRVWLTPPHTISCQTPVHLLSPILQESQDPFVKYKKGVLQANNSYIGNRCSFIEYSLRAIIVELENEETNIYGHFSKYYSNRMKKLDLSLNDRTFGLKCTCFKNKYTSDIIFDFKRDYPVIFYMKKRLEIVAELKKVLRESERHKINWKEAQLFINIFD